MLFFAATQRHHYWHLSSSFWTRKLKSYQPLMRWCTLASWSSLFTSNYLPFCLASTIPLYLSRIFCVLCSSEASGIPWLKSLEKARSKKRRRTLRKQTKPKYTSKKKQFDQMRKAEFFYCNKIFFQVENVRFTIVLLSLNNLFYVGNELDI